jgi:hypothetical protein
VQLQAESIAQQLQEVFTVTLHMLMKLLMMTMLMKKMTSSGFPLNTRKGVETKRSPSLETLVVCSDTQG